MEFAIIMSCFTKCSFSNIHYTAYFQLKHLKADFQNKMPLVKPYFLKKQNNVKITQL